MNTLTKIILLSILCIALVGCQKDTNEDTTTTDNAIDNASTTVEPGKETVVEEVVVEEKVVERAFGGQLRVALNAPTTLDPLLNDKQTVQQILGLIFEPLFVLDESLKPMPRLVDHYEFADEGRTLTLTLKDNVNFHDGQALTTADVEYTIQAIQDSKSSGYSASILPIKRIVIIDEKTMNLSYDKAYAFALNDLTFPIVSKAYSQSDTYDELIPIGTGPYKYVDYQQMQHLDLSANTDWHYGEVSVSAIQGIIIEDETSYETLFDQHLIDVMNPNRFNWLKYSENDDQGITSYASSYYDFLGFNFDNDLLTDEKLRQAFAYAVDREFIVYDRFINHGTLVNAPIIPDSWYDTEAELAYMYDSEKAKSLIPSSIIDNDNDGFYDMADIIDSNAYETIELKMIVNETNALRVNNAEYIKANIEAIGFKIAIEVLNPNDYYYRLNTGDYDLVYGGWKLSATPNYVNLFDSLGKQNFINYSSERMDVVLDKVMNAYTDEQMLNAVADFEQVMIDEVPYISLYFLDGAIMNHSNVYGSFKPTTESMFNGIEDVYLDFTE